MKTYLWKASCRMTLTAPGSLQRALSTAFGKIIYLDHVTRSGYGFYGESPSCLHIFCTEGIANQSSGRGGVEQLAPTWALPCSQEECRDVTINMASENDAEAT